MTKIYRPPESENASVKNQNQQKMSVLVSIGIFVLNLFVIYFLTFTFIAAIKYELYEFEIISTTSQRLVIDTILSLIILTGFYCLVISFRLIHGVFINITTAGCFWFYWYIESGFFKYGFNDQFPLWYEINMAANDIIAVVLSCILMRGRLLAAKAAAKAQAEAEALARISDDLRERIETYEQNDDYQSENHHIRIEWAPIIVVIVVIWLVTSNLASLME